MAVEAASIEKLDKGELSFSEFLKVYGELAHTMDEIAGSPDLLLMIRAEQAIINYDLNEYSSRQYAIDVYRRAADDLDEMEEKILEATKDPGLYHGIVSAGTRWADHRNGLPIDGMRKLISSHRTRLKNLYAGRNKDSQMELAFLDNRYACVEAMQKAYISQQRDALEKKEE